MQNRPATLPETIEVASPKEFTDWLELIPHTCGLRITDKGRMLIFTRDMYETLKAEGKIF